MDTLYIYIRLNYKSHIENFNKTSTLCFTLLAHQEAILYTNEKYIIKIIKHIKLIIKEIRIKDKI